MSIKFDPILGRVRQEDTSTPITVPSDSRFNSIATRNASIKTWVSLQDFSIVDDGSIVTLWRYIGADGAGPTTNTDWSNETQLIQGEAGDPSVLLDNLEEGEIPVKRNNELDSSGATVNDEMFDFDRAIQTVPGTVFIGENFALKGSINALLLETPTAKPFLLLGTQFNTTTGVSETVAYTTSAPETIQSQPISDVNTTETSFSFTYTQDTGGIYLTNTQRTFTSGTLSFVTRLNDENGPIVAQNTGVVLGVGDVTYTHDNSYYALAGQIFHVTINTSVPMLQGAMIGGNFQPYLIATGLPITRVAVITVDNLLTEMTSRLESGSNVTLTTVGNKIRISSTGGGGASSVIPSVHNLSSDIPSRVDVGTNLNVSHDFTFSITNRQSVQSLVLNVVGGDSITLTNPTSDGVQTVPLTLQGIDTSFQRNITFQLVLTDTQSNTHTSNVISVNISDPIIIEPTIFGYVSQNTDLSTIVTFDDQILTSTDPHRNWTVANIPSDSNLYKLYFAVPTSVGQVNSIHQNNFDITNQFTPNMNITVNGVDYNIRGFVTNSAVNSDYNNQILTTS